MIQLYSFGLSPQLDKIRTGVERYHKPILSNSSDAFIDLLALFWVHVKSIKITDSGRMEYFAMITRLELFR